MAQKKEAEDNIVDHWIYNQAIIVFLEKHESWREAGLFAPRKDKIKFMWFVIVPFPNRQCENPNIHQEPKLRREYSILNVQLYQEITLIKLFYRNLYTIKNTHILNERKKNM